MNELNFDLERSVGEGPESALERRLIRSYLKEKGHTLETLKHLSREEARSLMVEACKYASLKLAEVESRAHLVHNIHGPDKL
jgi:hypothetical protein